MHFSQTTEDIFATRMQEVLNKYSKAESKISKKTLQASKTKIESKAMTNISKLVKHDRGLSTKIPSSLVSPQKLNTSIGKIEGTVKLTPKSLTNSQVIKRNKMKSPTKTID